MSWLMRMMMAACLAVTTVLAAPTGFHAALAQDATKLNEALDRLEKKGVPLVRPDDTTNRVPRQSNRVVDGYVCNRAACKCEGVSNCIDLIDDILDDQVKCTRFSCETNPNTNKPQCFCDRGR